MELLKQRDKQRERAREREKERKSQFKKVKSHWEMSAKARMSTRQPPVVTVFYIIQATIERSHTLETNIYRTQITWHTNVGSVKTSLYHMLYCSEDTNLFTSSIAQKMSICSYTVLLRRYQPAHTSIVQKIPTYSHLLLFWTCQPAHTLYINLLTSSLSHPVLLICFI